MWCSQHGAPDARRRLARRRTRAAACGGATCKQALGLCCGGPQRRQRTCTTPAWVCNAIYARLLNTLRLLRGFCQRTRVVLAPVARQNDVGQTAVWRGRGRGVSGVVVHGVACRHGVHAANMFASRPHFDVLGCAARGCAKSPGFVARSGSRRLAPCASECACVRARTEGGSRQQNARGKRVVWRGRWRGVAWPAVVRATKRCTPPGTRCEPNPRCRLARQRNCATAACGGVARKQALGLLGAPWQTCIPAWAHANSVGVLLQVGKSHATRHICAGDHAHRATCTTNKQRTRSKSNTRTAVQRSRWCGTAGLFADECWLESGCCAAAHSVCYFRRRCFGVWQKARPCFGTHFLVHNARARCGRQAAQSAWRGNNSYNVASGHQALLCRVVSRESGQIAKTTQLTPSLERAVPFLVKASWGHNI